MSATKTKDPTADLTLEMTLKYDKCLSSQNENILYFIINSFCKDTLIDKLDKLMLKLLSQKLKSEEIVCRKHATIRIAFKSFLRLVRLFSKTLQKSFL